MPMVNGAPGADRLPTFATYNATRKSDEEQQPLRSQAMSNETTLTPSTRDAASERYYGGPPARASSQPPQFRPRDQFGTSPPPIPIGAAIPLQGRRSGDEPTPPSPYRDRSAPPPGGRPYPSRGRGGYPPRGGYTPRGGFGPRGPPPQGYPGRGGFSTEMRGGYTGRGRGGYGAGAAVGAVGVGMAAGAMMGGSRLPPPGYPPTELDSTSERVASSGEYPLAMGPPVPADPSQKYVESNERRFDAGSPSVYTQPDEQQLPYGARAQSPRRDRASPYGSRIQSPSGTLRQPSPPPAMPALPVNQAGEMAGTSAHDWNSRRSQSQDP